MRHHFYLWSFFICILLMRYKLQMFEYKNIRVTEVMRLSSGDLSENRKKAESKKLLELLN